MKQVPEPLLLRLPELDLERLDAFEALLEARATAQGLIASSDSGRIFERHVVDSLRAAAVLTEEERVAVDLGSGAGLPGIPLAIALPRCEVTLVESRARRAAFLELAVERLGLENAVVKRTRVEELVPGFDVATARAFADLAGSWRAAARLLREGGRLVYFGGAGLEDPRADAATLSPHPALVAEERVLETATPLVIMTRG